MVLHTKIVNEKNMEFEMPSRLFYTRTVQRKPSSKAKLKGSLLLVFISFVAIQWRGTDTLSIQSIVN